MKENVANNWKDLKTKSSETSLLISKKKKKKKKKKEIILSVKFKEGSKNKPRKTFSYRSPVNEKH